MRIFPAGFRVISEPRTAFLRFAGREGASTCPRTREPKKGREGVIWFVPAGIVRYTTRCKARRREERAGVGVGQGVGPLRAFFAVINGPLANSKNELHNFRASMLKPRFGKVRKRARGVCYAPPDLSHELNKSFIIRQLGALLIPPG